MTRIPTIDQQCVLDSAARVRFVKASPGSGKTWLVAEAIQRELSDWSAPHAGVAALSFTRVGGDEIRSALGRELAHPHFVGTIDAFLFRFVVRPHLHVVDPLARMPVLIPPDWRPSEIWQSQALTGGINPFACTWVRRDQTGKPVLSLERPGDRVELDGEARRSVIEFKKNLRRRRGIITISDSALFASEILTHNRHGVSIRRELARRFPLLVVDELQDTGVFLGESVRSLASEDAVRTLLVGDPDQAIFEFSGADLRTFDAFSGIPGIETLELPATQRCPAVITAVASQVKSTGGALRSSAATVGNATLVRYSDMTRDIRQIVNVARTAWPRTSMKVIARHNTSVLELKGRSGSEAVSLNCRPATLMHRAVRNFRQGRSIAALAAAHTALEVMLLEREGLTEEELTTEGIDAREFRLRSIDCLLDASALPLTGTVFEWQARAFDLVCAHAEHLRVKYQLPQVRGRRPPSRRQGHGRSIAASIQPTSTVPDEFGDTPVLTVHGVKGETHDITIFVIPPVSERAAPRKCPSVVWWPSDPADDEERRIAYVAFTRSRERLILCVHDLTYERLQRSRPAFVAAFECCDVASFSDSVARAGTTSAADAL
jgi:DNA helicase-2/ATP-dependent DNA helicase PcrA